MFGSRQRVRPPVLLILVYGAFLALVGITAAAQSLMVTTHFSLTAINDIAGSDAATTRAFFSAYVKSHYLETGPGGPSDAELSTLEGQLATLVRPGELLRIEIRLPDGRIVAANERALRGVVVPVSRDFERAALGAPDGDIVRAEVSEAGPGSLVAPMLLREYLPIRSADRVRAVVAIWRDATPIVERLALVRRDIVVVTLSAAALAAVLLFLIFRSAQSRLTRQTVALVEATRRDVLTGTLNHGALVEHLAVETERTRSIGGRLAVALIDVDNFRLLNESHGHAAGDGVLLSVVELLKRELPSSAAFGRYGPDEFLVVAPRDAADELPGAIERIRTAVRSLALEFESTERLPVSMSAGLAWFPEHGASVTVLLATVAQTLEGAKASGGDATRTPEDQETDATSVSFDVLQGLVIAVDTKDRYTKRHSEDVARYAVFLAERLGLDEQLIRSIRISGLLHDVGKIGVPDRILRKPGRLTAEEHEILKQHVALGDMIVRDLPEIELVRAGIRHHHERWDGEGYLDRLAGESIPAIARILAVCDAFSAMTTTRPYRKSLGIREALTRLEDAAGTQLDERLVRVFIEALETAADAPLPDNDVSPRLLWTLRDVA